MRAAGSPARLPSALSGVSDGSLRLWRGSRWTHTASPSSAFPSSPQQRSALYLSLSRVPRNQGDKLPESAPCAPCSLHPDDRGKSRQDTWVPSHPRSPSRAAGRLPGLPVPVCQLTQAFLCLFPRPRVSLAFCVPRTPLSLCHTSRCFQSHGGH